MKYESTVRLSRNQKTQTAYKIEIKLSLRIEVDGPQKQTDFWTVYFDIRLVIDDYDYFRPFTIVLDRSL